MNFPMNRLHLNLFLILGFLFSTTHSLRFELKSGQNKCISEEMKSNSMTVGKYNIVNPHEGQPIPESHKFTVKVTSPYGNNYHHGDLIESGQFAFTAAEAGDYITCFWALEHNPPVTLTVDFDWKSGIAAKDWTNVAKKGQVDTMEMELKKMLDTVTYINDEMYYLREREEEMQELNNSTSSTMGWLSVSSLLVCLAVAGLQLWHLKTFFEKKKLI